MNAVVFDLETAPIADAGTYVEPASAPSNYKDEAKIAAYIKAAEAEAVGKCSFDPDLCRIVALGWAHADEQEPCVVTCEDDAVEHMALFTFLRNLDAKTTLVGFNCLGFDLPVIMRRALYLGIPVPQIQIDKFRHPQVVDLMQVLSFNGAIKAHSLSFYTNRFNLPAVEDDVTGADIGDLVKKGEWPKIVQHCRADVLRTLHLARRIGVVQTPVAETVF